MARKLLVAYCGAWSECVSFKNSPGERVVRLRTSAVPKCIQAQWKSTPNDETQHGGVDNLKDIEADFPTWYMAHATIATPDVPYRYTSSMTAGGKVCGRAHSLILRTAANGSTNRAFQILTSPSGTRLEKQILYASRHREPETDEMYCN
jgi:hypothetical protein